MIHCFVYQQREIEMLKVVYKQKDGTEFNSLPESFTGYMISKYEISTHSIIEYRNGEIIGNITFRPTKTPVIFTVEYNGYNEMRYTNGKILTVWNQNGKIMEGECRKFSADGDLTGIEYYHKGNKVTQDIQSFLGTDKPLKDYRFGEDDIFNLYMLYGSKFKFYNEYKRDSKYFDEVANFCLK